MLVGFGDEIPAPIVSRETGTRGLRSRGVARARAEAAVAVARERGHDLRQFYNDAAHELQIELHSRTQPKTLLLCRT